MHGFAIKLQFLLAISSCCFSLPSDSTPGRCVPNKHRRHVLAISCYNVGLQSIPRNLDPDVEVLDARGNRIGRLDEDSLTRYPELRELYLQTCGMALIEPAAFSGNPRLEVLDLSHNVLRELPRELLGLPSLRKLYLHDNQLSEIQLPDLDSPAPLELLELQNNRLTRLPGLRPPELRVLDVSWNRVSRLRVNDLAALCSLQQFNFTGNPIEFDEGGCDCVELQRWIGIRGIRLSQPLECPLSMRERCNSTIISNNTLGLYHDCLERRRQRAEILSARSYKFWVITVLVLLCLTVIVTVGYLYYHRGLSKSKHRPTITVLPTPSPIFTEICNS